MLLLKTETFYFWTELQHRPHASQEDLSLECPLEAIAPVL